MLTAAVVGFVIGVPGLPLEPRAVVDGIGFQLGHASSGHLGYDGAGPSWWFHFSRSLPGNWGWPLTIAAGAAVVAALALGTRAQRLVALVAVALFATVGVSRVRFPHYVLPFLPLAAVLVAVLVTRLAAGQASRSLALLALVGLFLVPTMLDDVRLL